MSPVDREIPPAGEEIHLPPGSLQPLLLTVGITAALIGVTTWPALLIAGLVLTAVVLARWIVDARREMDALPVHHDEHH
jgi:hypothetical protein